MRVQPTALLPQGVGQEQGAIQFRLLYAVLPEAPRPRLLAVSHRGPHSRRQGAHAPSSASWAACSATVCSLHRACRPPAELFPQPRPNSDPPHRPWLPEDAAAETDRGRGHSLPDPYDQRPRRAGACSCHSVGFRSSGTARSTGTRAAWEPTGHRSSGRPRATPHLDSHPRQPVLTPCPGGEPRGCTASALQVPSTKCRMRGAIWNGCCAKPS